MDASLRRNFSQADRTDGIVLSTEGVVTHEAVLPLADDPRCLVPTLPRGHPRLDALRPDRMPRRCVGCGRDAERRPLHSHAERGNEKKALAGYAFPARLATMGERTKEGEVPSCLCT